MIKKKHILKDVSLIQKFIAELVAFDDDQIKVSDVDGNGAVNATDVTNIQKYLAEYFTRFPIERADENILAAFEKVLADYYNFSSYNQYQNLKKLYSAYKDIDFTVDSDENYQSYLELKDTMDSLTDIADYINGKATQGYDKDLVIYFAVPEEWLSSEYTVKSNICFDAGDNVWGQRDMIQTTDKFGGLTVFRYTYKADEFYSENIDKLQFQAYSGSTWKTQFVAVSDTTMCESINGMLYDSATQKWVDYTPTPGTIDVVEPAEADYALCYYSDTHSWDDKTSYFTKKSDGTYTFTYVADSAASISCNVFDLVNNEFNCVAASTSLTIASDAETSETYSLSASASRGNAVFMDIYHLLLSECAVEKKNLLPTNLPDNFAYAKTIIEYIGCNYTENINLKDMADLVGLTSSYFSKYFKNITGTNFTQYLY